MIFFIFVFTLYANSEIQLDQNLDGTENLSIVCKDESTICNNLCNKNKCTFTSGICTDCLSAKNQDIPLFLNYIGSYLKTENTNIDPDETFEVLQRESLFFWHVLSIYDTSKRNGHYINQRFLSLCPLGELKSRPIIIDQLDRNGGFNFWAKKYILCPYLEKGLEMNQLHYQFN